jgi:glutaredoxin-like protein
MADAIKMYGTRWCFDCRKAKKIFERNKIPYHWINIDEDKEGEQFVMDTNNGMRSVPTIVFTDGSILVEPSKRELPKKLDVPV